MTLKKIDKASPNRLYSLDALRGFDMFWITGGGALAMIISGSMNSIFFYLLNRFVSLQSISKSVLGWITVDIRRIRQSHHSGRCNGLRLVIVILHV